MDENQIIVFTGEHAFHIGVWLGIGAAAGAGLGIMAVDLLVKISSWVWGVLKEQHAK